jgi:hypothetical protein
MRTLLATPVLHHALSSRLLTIEVIGRKTGGATGYARPVRPHVQRHLDRHSRTLATQPGSRRAGQGSALTTLVGVHAEVVTDLARCADYYAAILPKNRTRGQVAGIDLHPDGSVCLDMLARALVRGVAVVRLVPPSQQPFAVGTSRAHQQ